MSDTILLVVSLLMAAIGAGFTIYLFRLGGGRPRGATQWAGAALSILLTVTAGLLFVLTLVGPPEAEVRGVASDEVVGQAAADFEVLRVSDDAPVRLSAYEGEVVLLNVWATWCAPCLRELPELNRLQEEYAEDGLTVVTLSDESPATLRDFNREMPLETVNVYLPDAQETMPDVFREGLMIRPTTYLIDREGTVRDVFNGARDYDFFEQAVRQYL